MKVAYFTICSRNYLAYALTLRDSMRAAMARDFFIVLADDEAGTEEIGDVIAGETLGAEAYWDMAARYDVMEFNTAIKPFAVLHLFSRGYDAAIYLDPDILVLRPLEAAERALEDADCVLTPHLLQPLNDTKHPGDIEILRSGVYNFGFCGFRDSVGARRFLDWWARACETLCVVDLPRGLFVDQRLADYAPAFADKAAILRDPGYNVAYWNIKHRPLKETASGWSAADAPLVFFHFSGVMPDDPGVFSKHQNRFQLNQIGDAARLQARYVEKLHANNHAKWRRTPYAYDRASDGVRITRDMRRLYAAAGKEMARSRAEAFELDYNIYNAPDATTPRGGALVTAFMRTIYDARKDLQEAFSLAEPEGRREFMRWFVNCAIKEHDAPLRVVEPVRAALAELPAPPTAHVPPAAIAAALPLRRALQSVYGSSAPLRQAYRAMPLRFRQGVRRWLIRADSQSDAAEAMQAPTLQLAHGQLDESLAPGVDLYGYLRTESGVGEGARRARRAIAAAGVACDAVIIGTQGVFEDSIKEEPPAAAGPHRIALLHVNADQTPLLGKLVDAGRLNRAYRIGYWAWELPRFPQAWSPAVDLVDEIWAPSNFAAQAFRAATSKPVRVIPHPAPISTAAPDRARFRLPEDRLIYYFNFDLNSYVERKNPHGVVEAFDHAFAGAADAPLLLFKTHGARRSGAAGRALLERLRAVRNVRIIDEVMTGANLDVLRACCDVYVSLHRAEGFGLGAAEFMALGKPVIATNFSGVVDFFDASVGMPVSFALRPVLKGEYPFADGQTWAEPDLDEAASAMRALAQSPELRHRLGAAGKARMESRFSYAAVGKLIRAELQRIDPAIQTMPAAARTASSAS